MTISFQRSIKSLTNFICLLAIITVALTNSANAQKRVSKFKSRNPYLITNIFSSAEELSPSASRQKAMQKANRIAFLVLLRNLKVEEGFLEKVGDEDIADAVYSRQILDERIAGNYYSAKFNISFLKSSVSAMLDVGKAQEVEKGEEEVFLLFPVEMMDGRPVLWEKNNEWRKALEESINFSNVRNIIIPTGDYADIISVNLKNIQSSKFSNFNSMISRYGADSAIVAYFDFDDIENKANIKLTIVRQAKTDRVRLNFVNSKNLSRSGLLLEVADRTVNHVVNSNEVEVKRVVQVSKDKMPINVEIADLEEWMAIKARLESMYFIKDLKLESISRNTVKVFISHSSTNGDIEELFAKHNFLLRQNRKGEYFLSAK